MNDKLERLSASLLPAVPPQGTPREIAVPFQRSPMEVPEPGGEFSLREYWRVVHARRRTILATIAAALALAAIYNYVKVPTYRATAALQIDREQRSIARMDQNGPQLPERPDYIETQYKVLKSRTLAKRVIDKLALDDLAELSYGIKSARDGGVGSTASAGGVLLHPEVVDSFLERLTVDPGKGTRLVDVSFESVHRELAPRVVNTLAEEYIEHNFEAKWNATQKASAWLEQQLSTLQARLEASESELHEYGAAHSILLVEERKDISTEKLAHLEDELTRAEADRIERQSLAMLVEDALRRGAGLPGSLGSKTYQELRSTLVELRRERSRLLVTFAPGYPAVRRVQREMEEVQESVEQEKERLLAGAREAYQLAMQREQLLGQAALAQRRLVNRVSDDFIQYNILKREAESNRQLYEGLLQRLKEAGVSAGLRASNIAVLDPAEIPERSYRPKKLLNFVLALAAGLSLGVVLAFAQEHLNTLVRTPEEVERWTGLDLLAVIPRSRTRPVGRVRTRMRISHRAVSISLVRSRQSGGFPTLAIVPPERPERNGLERTRGRRERRGPSSTQEHSPQMAWQPEKGLSEAYRTLRSSVLLGWDESMRRLLITSSQPQEGKTTVSLNLACSLAQLGRRVLLIDADMRRPNCARQLEVETSGGLSEYLQGLAELEQILVETSIPGLSLVPGGRSNSVASDLLHSPRLACLLQEAGRLFEHVVIDSPPSLVLSDARTISSMVEGVVMVVSDVTERNALLRTKQIFDDAGVRFLGFVMNRVNLDNLDYGYYRDYGYDYSYSDEQG